MVGRESRKSRRHFAAALLLLLWLPLSAPAAQQPPDDFWKTSTPQAQGLNAGMLNSLSKLIRNGSYGEIHSLLIVRHGYLVFERYYRGYERAELHPVYSVTKSVTSALIGIEWDRKQVFTSQRLLRFFPGYQNINNLDSRKRAITLHHVLTMTAAFDWNELSVPYGDPRNPTYQMAGSPDWIRFVLDRRMSDQPGKRFSYNSGCTVLLSGVLANLTGAPADEFTRRVLFGPLSITGYRWERAPQNLTNTAWGLSLRPRDMLKLGYLFLNNGRWLGRTIVSPQWVRKSTTPFVKINRSFAYGYQWWLMPLDAAPDIVPSFRDIYIAWGYGGQFIFVIPREDLVVVSTAGNFNNDDDMLTIEFLRNWILKSIRR